MAINSQLEAFFILTWNFIYFKMICSENFISEYDVSKIRQETLFKWIKPKCEYHQLKNNSSPILDILSHTITSCCLLDRISKVVGLTVVIFGIIVLYVTVVRICRQMRTTGYARYETWTGWRLYRWNSRCFDWFFWVYKMRWRKILIIIETVCCKNKFELIFRT
jgi:hypothetical protein